MSTSPADRIHADLAASRAEADRLLAQAQRRAAFLSAAAESSDRALAAARLARLGELRDRIAERRTRTQDGYASLVEAMAVAAARLAAAARTADFSPPPWPDDIGRAVEVRLSQTRRVVSETREVTIRLPGRGSGGAATGERA